MRREPATARITPPDQLVHEGAKPTQGEAEWDTVGVSAGRYTLEYLQEPRC
jgi:hypothetical protein